MATPTVIIEQARLADTEATIRTEAQSGAAGLEEHKATADFTTTMSPSSRRLTSKETLVRKSPMASLQYLHGVEGLEHLTESGAIVAEAGRELGKDLPMTSMVEVDYTEVVLVLDKSK